MKQLRAFSVILAVSCLGEVCHQLIPAPIPASIYGMVILFLLLLTGLVKAERIRQTGHFLVEIMSVLFVCPAVGLLSAWELFSGRLWQILVIIAVSLVVTFAVSGLVTQALLKRKGEDDDG